MRKIVFSFDDGRKDTFENAYPILKKYSLPATINISTSFVENPDKFKGQFVSSKSKSMSIDNVIEMYKNGFEIASHGDNHKNDKKDICESLKKLSYWGINVEKIGFASPNSYYNNDNYAEIKPLIESKTIKYVRSGRQLKRDGLLYGIISYLSEVTHSKFLFYISNKRNIIKKGKNYKILPSITINSNITNKQICFLLNKIESDDSLILMYHAILDEDNLPLNNKWYNKIQDFDELCYWIHKNERFSVVRTIDLIDD